MIEQQIKETKELIAREEAEFEERYRQKEAEEEGSSQQHEKDEGVDRPADGEREPQESNGSSNNGPHNTDSTQKDQDMTDSQTEPSSITQQQDQADSSARPDSSHRHEEEGEEVMEEDKEDMVIY